MVDPAAKGFLSPNDPVAISFWIISISMVAATVFFLMESMTVSVHWKTSMNVGALVTLVAARLKTEQQEAVVVEAKLQLSSAIKAAEAKDGASDADMVEAVGEPSAACPTGQ